MFHVLNESRSYDVLLPRLHLIVCKFGTLRRHIVAIPVDQDVSDRQRHIPVRLLS